MPYPCLPVEVAGIVDYDRGHVPFGTLNVDGPDTSARPEIASKGAESHTD